MGVVRLGSRVSWAWGRGTGHGIVEDVFTAPVSRMIRGKLIRRKASPENPTYLIRNINGGVVLKSATEVVPDRR